jgi:hypothetical protein
LQRDCFKTRLRLLCLGAAVYNIWKQRNVILRSSNILTEEAIILRIKWEVTARMLIGKRKFQAIYGKYTACSEMESGLIWVTVCLLVAELGWSVLSLVLRLVAVASC